MFELQDLLAAISPTGAMLTLAGLSLVILAAPYVIRENALVRAASDAEVEDLRGQDELASTLMQEQVDAFRSLTR